MTTRTTYSTATSTTQAFLRQEMMRKLSTFGLYLGDIQFEIDVNGIESVCVSILDPKNEWRPIGVSIRCFVSNPHWFIEGDDNYRHALSDFELCRVLGWHGVGKHCKLNNWKKVWVVSSGYSRIAMRPHGSLYYYASQTNAFTHAMEVHGTAFCIVTTQDSSTQDDCNCESVTDYEYDSCRDTGSFSILVEPINFGSHNL